MKPLQVFIGYDPREAVAYHVLAHSIMRRASRPVSITPLYRPQLGAMGVYLRERGPTESTDFSLTRFLVPYLSDFEGVSIFMDCDCLCLGDVVDLERAAHADPYADVFVVKHEYTPKHSTKFLGQPQTAYPRKNWSSVMVFNNHRQPVRRLRPEYINRAHPSELHQFEWAQFVSSLPPEWNHLVGEYDPNPAAKLVHFTLGGPWFSDYKDCEFAAHWFAEAGSALRVQEEDGIIPSGNTVAGAAHDQAHDQAHRPDLPDQEEAA